MMREGLREFILLSFLCGASLAFCPEGGVKRILPLLCTGILVSAIIKPLFGFDVNAFTRREAAMNSAETEILQNAKAGQDLLARYALQERCERYITQKAATLGLNVKAKVELRRGPDNVWIPYAAAIQARDPKEAAALLGGLLHGDLGIPEERQEWLSDD